MCLQFSEKIYEQTESLQQSIIQVFKFQKKTIRHFYSVNRVKIIRRTKNVLKLVAPVTKIINREKS